MDIIWLVAKFIIYTGIVVALYRQSYNFIFFLARRPITWIIIIGLFGISNMGLAYLLGWDPQLVSAVILTAFIFNVTPLPPTGYTKEDMRTMVDEVYKEMGLPHGRIQSRIGLAAFGLCSLVSYMLFFGCNLYIGDGCIPIFPRLLQ